MENNPSSVWRRSFLCTRLHWKRKVEAIGPVGCFWAESFSMMDLLGLVCSSQCWSQQGDTLPQKEIEDQDAWHFPLLQSRGGEPAAPGLPVSGPQGSGLPPPSIGQPILALQPLPPIPPWDWNTQSFYLPGGQQPATPKRFPTPALDSFILAVTSIVLRGVTSRR